MPKASNRPPVAKRLKELRTSLGISQTAVGVKIGLDEGVASARMNRYEKGIHTPDFSTIKKIAEIFDVPSFYFYVEDDYVEEIKVLLKLDI